MKLTWFALYFAKQTKRATLDNQICEIVMVPVIWWRVTENIFALTLRWIDSVWGNIMIIVEVVIICPAMTYNM